MEAQLPPAVHGANDEHPPSGGGGGGQLVEHCQYPDWSHQQLELQPGPGPKFAIPQPVGPGGHGAPGQQPVTGGPAMTPLELLPELSLPPGLLDDVGGAGTTPGLQAPQPTAPDVEPCALEEEPVASELDIVVPVVSGSTAPPQAEDSAPKAVAAMIEHKVRCMGPSQSTAHASRATNTRSGKSL
jgi:hypothetical protein